MTDARRSYALLSALIRSLSHQLRTSLSVISNDLSYFKNHFPEGECDRALERCREIATVLGEHALPQLEQQNWRVMTVPQIIKEVLPDWIAACDLDLFPDKASRELNVPVLRLGFEMTEKILRELPRLGFVDKQADLRAALELDVDRNAFVVNYGVALISPLIPPRSFSSFTAALVEECGFDLSLAPLADAIYEACGCSVEVAFDDRLTLKLLVPLLES